MNFVDFKNRPLTAFNQHSWTRVQPILEVPFIIERHHLPFPILELPIHPIPIIQPLPPLPTILISNPPAIIQIILELPFIGQLVIISIKFPVPVEFRVSHFPFVDYFGGVWFLVHLDLAVDYGDSLLGGWELLVTQGWWMALYDVLAVLDYGLVVGGWWGSLLLSWGNLWVCSG